MDSIVGIAETLWAEQSNL